MFRFYSLSSSHTVTKYRVFTFITNTEQNCRKCEKKYDDKSQFTPPDIWTSNDKGKEWENDADVIFFSARRKKTREALSKYISPRIWKVDNHS